MMQFSRGPPFVVDWLCPFCDTFIEMHHTGSMRCIHCGLQVGESPTQKLDGPKDSRNQDYIEWVKMGYPEKPMNYEDWRDYQDYLRDIAEAENDGRAGGAKSPRKTPHHSRPVPPAKRRRRP